MHYLCAANDFQAAIQQREARATTARFVNLNKALTTGFSMLRNCWSRSPGAYGALCTNIQTRIGFSGLPARVLTHLALGDFDFVIVAKRIYLNMV